MSDTLNKIAENLPTEKGIDELKAHIKPRSKFERFFRINKPKGNAAEIINNANLTDQEKEILKKKNIEQADIPFRVSFKTKLPFISFDKENINLNISDVLSNLTAQIRQNKQETKTTSLINLPQEEILTMCASGKDREGLNEHNKISQAVSKKYTGIKDIDKQLLKNCHIAQQSGSIYAGGATIGCCGTKKENKRVIPKSRKETLAAIMALTAKTNKIEDKKKMDKNIDAEYEKITLENLSQ
ncbi:MAG: hypothetical protein AB8U36_06670, partial [Rickettsia aeschlimannii]